MRRLRLAGFVVLVGTLVGAATAAGSAQSPAGTMRGAADIKTVKYPKPEKSETVLKADHQYKIVARDTVGYWPVGSSEYPDAREGEGADALYCYVTWRCPKPELWRQLRINGLALDEFAGLTGKIPYNASHVYPVTVSGVTGKLTYTSAGGQSGGFTVEVIDLGAATATPKPAKRECDKTYVIQPSGVKITAKLMLVELTPKRLDDLVRKEAKKYEEHDYSPIGPATRKQNCAGYVMRKLFGSKMVQANVITTDFYRHIVMAYGEKRLSRLTAQPGDVVVYKKPNGDVQHVAIVDAKLPRIRILTKDGDERPYRGTFPVVPLRLTQDPLVTAHTGNGAGTVEFWKLDTSRVRIQAVSAGPCDTK